MRLVCVSYFSIHYISLISAEITLKIQHLVNGPKNIPWSGDLILKTKTNNEAVIEVKSRNLSIKAPMTIPLVKTRDLACRTTRHHASE